MGQGPPLNLPDQDDFTQYPRNPPRDMEDYAKVEGMIPLLFRDNADLDIVSGLPLATIVNGKVFAYDRDGNKVGETEIGHDGRIDPPLAVPKGGKVVLSAFVPKVFAGDLSKHLSIGFEHAAPEGPCPHMRPSWRMCPHCLGINSIDWSKVRETAEAQSQSIAGQATSPNRDDFVHESPWTLELRKHCHLPDDVDDTDPEAVARYVAVLQAANTYFEWLVQKKINARA